MTFSSPLNRIIPTAAALVLNAAACFPQGFSGTIAGLIKDPSQATVPGAKVMARDVATRAEARATTGPDGLYRFSSLAPGEYEISVEASGFRKAASLPLRLSVADTLRLDFALELGSITESVTVEAPAVAVNTEDAQLGKVVRDPSGLPVLSGA